MTVVLTIRDVPRDVRDALAQEARERSQSWQSRRQISGYDAAYVALAVARDLTLITADARLARAAVGHCRVELAN
jgi:predicted nucleic acid-binding protein